MRRVTLTGALTATLMLLGSAAASAYPVPLPDPPSPRPSAHVRAEVTALRTATRPFHNLQRASNAGYRFFTDTDGVACIDMPGMGGMGVHFVDSDLVGNPAERVRHPEALVYRLDKQHRLRLAAVEYLVIASDWDATHARPPHRFGQEFALTAAGNRYGLPAFYSLHAWVWYHNPAGRFEMFNPRVSCTS